MASTASVALVVSSVGEFIALTPFFWIHVFQRSEATLTGQAAKELIDNSGMGIDGSDNAGDAAGCLVATKPCPIRQRKLRGFSLVPPDGERAVETGSQWV